MRVPLHLELVEGVGGVVFFQPYSANLVAVRGPGGPGDWDGLLHLSWYQERPTAGWTTHTWPCATRPGFKFLRNPLNEKGTATIALGQYRNSHELGRHNGRPALVQVPGAVVRVMRDPDRDRKYEPEVEDTGDALNIHDVDSPGDLAGCIGLDPGFLRDLLFRYRYLQGHAPSLNRRVSLSVVAG